MNLCYGHLVQVRESTAKIVEQLHVAHISTGDMFRCYGKSN